MSWQAYWDNEGVLPKPMDDADFASLLEREPYDPFNPHESFTMEPLIKVNPALVHQTAFEMTIHERDKYKAFWLAEQQMRQDDSARMETLEKGVSSASEHIKQLKDVLVAIRAKAALACQSASADVYDALEIRSDALGEISTLINETLDPCKPWCTRDEPGHKGACEPNEDERDSME